jgi:hypothetical protein
MLKTIIYYHRAYRKITGSGHAFILEILVLSLPLSLLLLFLSPYITHGMSLFAKFILSPYYPPGTVQLFKRAFFFTTISLIDIPSPYPSYLCILINVVVSSVLILFLPQINKGKNTAIYILYLATINLVSSLFFISALAEFPYSALEFSELYMASEICILFFIPFILGTAILLLPDSLFPKIMLLLLTVLYAIIIGALRYVLFLFIISKFSILYMALLYFAFGPLIDFIYIVGIFSYYNGKIATNLHNSNTVWKWSY